MRLLAVMVDCLANLRVVPAALGLIVVGTAWPVTAADSVPTLPIYEIMAASADGTGKFFAGREIAQVMGHQGADWLERPERATEERPDHLLAALKLKPGEVVADIGAGTGYYSWRLAKAVGPSGRVLAVEIQQEMLDRLIPAMTAHGVTNFVPVLGEITDPKLPTAGVDLVLMVDVYHEFSHPQEMLTSITRSLKPGGRVVFVEFRAEDPAVPIKPLHKMSEAQVRLEAGRQPLVWVETVRTLPWQHVIIFRKADHASRSADHP